jgi:hypothetical protein
VSTIFDPDEDPRLRRSSPYDFPLSKSGFSKSLPYSIATEDGTVASGAIIETVLGSRDEGGAPTWRARSASPAWTIEARSARGRKVRSVALQVLEKDTPIAVRTIEPEPHSVFGVPFHTAVLYRWEYVPPTRESTRTQACEPTFRRGDANDDARVDISDAIATLAFLFLDRGEPACLDAADSNDDGRADVSDVIFTLDDLFGPYAVSRIPAPGPSACGLDPTSDELGCGLLASCSPQ